MKSSLNSAKKNTKETGKKTAIFFLVSLLLFSFLLTPLKTAKAQFIDPMAAAAAAAAALQRAAALAQTTAESAYSKAKATLVKLLLKAGATSFQMVVRTALNKIAYDTATYLGSGGKGQKPLFITEGWDKYLLNVGDAAVGQFIETFVNNLGTEISADCQKTYQVCAKACEGSYNASSTGFSLSVCAQTCKDKANKCAGGSAVASTTGAIAGASAGVGAATLTSLNVCQPSSLEVKLRISLGLVEQRNPIVNCTATKMISNWGDEAKKIADWKSEDFLYNMKGFFDPTSNDLGIYMSAQADMLSAEAGAKTLNLNKLVANKGWLDKVNIAGNPEGTPEDPSTKAEAARISMINNLGKTTGDIIVDAANVFVNQLAITAFNNLMSSLGKKATDNIEESANSLRDPESGAGIVYGEGSFKEAISSILKPDFSVRANYDILSKLAVCPDASNPGPTDCVLDSQFMQAVAENKTVAEAINDGYINGGWQLTKDTVESAYSLRNISILRKYRILPVGWEEAINLAYASSTKVTVMDMVSCFDDDDAYKDFSPSSNLNKEASRSWCQGLVDPNWVLKAPLNSCSKEGVGAQIIGNPLVIPSFGTKGASEYMASSYSVARGEEYCADDKTCIKEKDDGSCEAYGYCNEEKRTWNFSADSCAPIYNTCRSFTKSESGKSVSYLENTLDYSGCDSESAGCRQYSVFGTYTTSTGAVAWDANKKIYLNKNASSCSSDDEACTELLRVKPTWGSNLVMDSDYNNEVVGDASNNGTALKDWAYWVSNNITSNNISIVDANTEPGASSDKALKLKANGSTNATISAGIYSNASSPLLPDNFQLVAGQTYTVSADVYLAEGSKATLYMGTTAADGFVQSVTGTGSWQHLSATRNASGSYNEPAFGISAESSDGSITVYVQHLTFEVSNYDTTQDSDIGYNIYGSTYKVYEKLIPPYLENVCYNNVSSAIKNYTLKSDAPAVCSNFARRCNRDEVGCELFTGVKDNISVTAQITATDGCWEECVGYDTYVSKENYFNSTQAENIIPAKAAVCNAAAVGCNEFTNLDELNAGGENKEYYSSLKQCIKPGQGVCGAFYSWEGTASGYQLRSYSLEQTGQGEPKVTTASDSQECSAEIYNKAINDADYNADCREFYSSTGSVFYHLISKTITCSDNCHAYRMSEKNINTMLTTQVACAADDKANDADSDSAKINNYWDATLGVCYSCLNGGTWDAGAGACIYQAIPGEGMTCSAEQKNCREYNGGSGNNVQRLAAYDFETGLQGWASDGSGSLQGSPISNNKDGHSLFYGGSGDTVARLGVSSLVREGKSYTLRFIAKSDGAANVNLKIYFSDNSSSPQEAQFSPAVIKKGGEWNIYSANINNLNHPVTKDEILAIAADGNFYFDDVVLTEITDRYYLIEGSINPLDMNICYFDLNNVYQGVDYNLGCSKYKDRDNNTPSLRKFSKLCSSSSVGCEQVIATQNSDFYGSSIWPDKNNDGVCDATGTDCVEVDRDEAIYAILDSSHRCNSADLGCSRLGQGTTDGTAWSDVFKLNNPNLYDRTLCSQAKVGCEEWTADNGSLNYFRDPGNEVCQYRASHNPENIDKAWYKIPVKRCTIADGNGVDNGVIDTSAEKSGKVCGSDKDCSSGKCIVDNNDYLCSSSYYKTFGLGGSGNGIKVPNEQAGLCTATASGCTEYIDPVSEFSVDLVSDPSHKLPSADEDGGWDSNGKQTVMLIPNKLYILSITGTSPSELSETTLTFDTGVKRLLIDNTLSATSSMTIEASAGTSTRIMFASLNSSQVKIAGGETGKTIELKEAVINYQLQKNVDTASCNNAVNFDKGCVLFNERSINGAAGLVSLDNKFNAVLSNAVENVGKAPKNCASLSENCNANKLIKVSPNRVCSKWLDCISYVDDPDTGERTCYAVGECTSLNDKNECANFENVATGTIKFNINPGQNKNSTGYYLLDKYHLSNMKEVGLNTDAHYDFEDSIPTLSCERAGGGECASKNIIADLLVREPEKAPVTYPAHGTSYLKVPAAYIISPQSKGSAISVQASLTYFVNFLVNTEKAGVNANIKIVAVSGTVETSSLLNENIYSNNGWSRKILKFSTRPDTKEIRIYLGASDTKSDSAVYFDDINIEPVLETGKDATGISQYTSRECRLYPTSDSLTCVNKNNNVLKDGWEGYCLEHDINNPNVCLLWYPVDKISAERPIQLSSGYQGIFPLNYCAEVNGNFDLVKKVKGAIIHVGREDANKTDEICTNPRPDYEICIAASYGCDRGSISGSFNTDICGSNYETIWFTGDAGNHSYSKVACVPKEENLILKTNKVTISKSNFDLSGCSSNEYDKKYFNANDELSYWEGWIKYDGKLEKKENDCAVTLNYCAVNPGNDQCAALGAPECSDLNEETNAIPPVRVLDYDRFPADDDSLKLISGTDTERIFRLTCNNFVQAVDSSGVNMAWAARVGINSIWSTSTPPYFVDKYDIDKYNNNETHYFDVQDRDVQNNTILSHMISAYGRNRETTPFGAAIWPDNFNLLNSEPVKLENQFSTKNKEDVLAGRPYGCSNYKIVYQKNDKGAYLTDSNGAYIISSAEKGDGCSHIGYCSLDPNVYCLVDTNDITVCTAGACRTTMASSSSNYVARKTCAEGGFGTCVPLWYNYLGKSEATNKTGLFDYQTILSTLFLKSYNSYSYSLDDASYLSGNLNINRDIEECKGARPEAVYSTNKNDLTAALASSSASFCSIDPTIGSSTLLYNASAITPPAVNRKGIYGLKFTTSVDPEQQPLKEIYIDWGGGSKQVISGQDSRPSASDPHIFYHYYREATSGIIIIQIKDNWNIISSSTVKLD